MIGWTIGYIIMIYVTYDSWYLLLLSLPCQFITLITLLLMYLDALIMLAMILVLAFYEHIRINLINRTFIRDKRISQSARLFIEQHNRFCTHIWKVDQAIRPTFLALIVTAMLINLLLMHQIIFEDLLLHIKMYYAFLIYGQDLILLALQYNFAILSAKIHENCLNLSRLQWSLNGYPFRLRIKLKILTCFERLSANKKIGISIASITLTMHLFSKVYNGYFFTAAKRNYL